MNKLLQTTLVAAILSIGVIAGEMTRALLKTIESGATVYFNNDITIGHTSPVTIDNYGTIDTEVTSTPYPKITGVYGAMLEWTLKKRLMKLQQLL